MTSIPWVTSPTEAFAMLRAGAGALKFFPSEIVSPSAVAAMKAVLPPAVLTVAVGGISGENMREFWAAGIDGFGLGSILYRPGWTPAQVRDAIRPLVQLAAELCDGPQRKEE